MDTDTTTETQAPAENGAEEGNEQKTEQTENVSIPKKEFETLNQTLGSLKREIKDLKKSKDDPKETSQKNQPEEFGLLQKTYLRSAGITADDEVELAKDIQKKSGLDWDKLVEDEYFKAKLDALRTQKSNEEAASHIKGGAGGGSEARNTADYWLKKGEMPTEEVAKAMGRKELAKFARARVAQDKPGFKFYNEK
jgi:hypothetical protein